MNGRRRTIGALLLVAALLYGSPAWAQSAPSAAEAARYTGLHRAAYDGDVAAIRQLVAAGAPLEARDGNGRTAVHVAAFRSQEPALEALVAAGADLNALDAQAYDVVTIAAVADDVELLRTALRLGARADQVTSPYDGTALIAAAHLGHAEVVRMLIAAGAPLNHVNNLGWTALIEAVVLGDGGPRHVATARALIEAGADVRIADRGQVTPLEHARRRGYAQLAALFPGAAK